ncbi:hypothetical protein [Pontiella sulfatireligans]|uniref:Uncharacterized protein n=1 Tax=Pontiella sulfatireligans TaxID=2750658 RepID=A0A6C2UP22_9BACT|nr:hypothetical protein [Pontiella sulfatireligans]VGO21067.1 hypothetical protein SCARR_03136 [Pontiella sulfatireligans]
MILLCRPGSDAVAARAAIDTDGDLSEALGGELRRLFLVFDD